MSTGDAVRALVREARADRLVTFREGMRAPGEIRATLACLARPGRLRDGRAASDYERDWEAFLSVRHAVAFGSGRLSFYAILRALDVGPGDEVIVPAYTCVVVPNAVVYAGARPVYADIERDSLNVDLRAVELRITPRTKAFVLSHNFGIPGNVDGAVKLAERAGVAMVEDGAHALGAYQGGRRIGTFGAAGFFSTEASKVMSTVRGGMAVTNDDGLAAALRRVQAECAAPSAATVRRLLLQHLLARLSAHPAIARVGALVWAGFARRGWLVPPMTREELAAIRPPGYEVRLSDAQAMLGRVQLRYLDDANRQRRRNAARLAAACRANGLESFAASPESEPVFVRYPVWVNDKAGVLAENARSRVEIGAWFRAVTDPSEAAGVAAGYVPGSCQIGEAAAAHVVNVPTHRALRDDDIRRVMAVLKSGG
jgi:perosamine synthetase